MNFVHRVLPVVLVLAGAVLLGYPLALVFGLPLARRDMEDTRRWLRETAVAAPADLLTADGGAVFGEVEPSAAGSTVLGADDGVLFFEGAIWRSGSGIVRWGAELEALVAGPDPESTDAELAGSPEVASLLSFRAPAPATFELYAETAEGHWRLLEAGAAPPALPPDGSRDRFTFGSAAGPILLGGRVLAADDDYELESGAVVFATPPPFGADLRRIEADYAVLDAATGLIALHPDAEITTTVRAAEAVIRLAPGMTGNADGVNREFAFPEDQVIEADRDRLVYVGDEPQLDTAERPAERVDGERAEFTFESDRGLVVVDGVLAEEGVHYLRSGNIITFTAPPVRNAQLRQYRDYWLYDPAGARVLMAEAPAAGETVWTSRYARYSRPACGATVMECFYALPQHPVPFPHWIAERFMPFVTRYPPADARNVMRATAYTSTGTMAGLALGGALGVLLAILFVAFRPLEQALLPWIIAGQTIPIIALVPVMLLVLGNFGITIQTSMLPTALVGAYLCFFPIAVSTSKGLRAVEPLALDLMKSYAATPLQLLLKVRLPAATPLLFTGMKLGMAAALVGALVAETESNNRRGLGYQILGQVQSGNVADVWILLLISAVLGIVLVALVGLVQRLAAPWERRE